MLELLTMCAPGVDPVTMAAVVKQESGGQPWVVNNNTTRKSTTFRIQGCGRGRCDGGCWPW
jgi:hypothetical protein